MKNKPVFMCLQGPSISSVKEYIPKLVTVDAIWASLNRFDLIEEDFNMEFDIVWISSAQRLLEVKYPPRMLIDHKDSPYAYGFSSLFAFLCFFIKEGYNEIYLFGADGGAKQGDVYFAQDGMSEDIEARRNSIWLDTQIMNDLFWKLVEYWGLGNKDTINIYNMNEESLITCFKNINFPQLFRQTKPHLF